MTKRHPTEKLGGWNNIAHNYIEMTESNKNRSQIQLVNVIWESLGDVNGLDVLDVGCGHGWWIGELEKAGAKTIGIDVSPIILEYARRKHPDVLFIEHDLLNGLPRLNKKFDRVIANMVLMNIADIGNVISAIREYIKPGGKFLFSITHPCFFNYEPALDKQSGQVYRKVTNYLKESIWRIETLGGHNHYHRSLTYYCDHLRVNKFAVTRFFEPINSPKSIYREHHNPDIPVFVFIEAIPIN